MDEPLIDLFLDTLWMEKGISVNTQQAYRGDLQSYCLWLRQQGVSLDKAARSHILSFLSDALKHQKARSIARLLSCLRSFYHFLLREYKITRDPTLNIQNPKLGRPLPHTLSEQDVEKLLSAPNLKTPLGQRDKAMMELVYATGLRVSELACLTLSELNLQQGAVQIVGKRNKERLVPIGEVAFHWTTRYLQETRSYFLRTEEEPPNEVFLSQRGKRLTRQSIWYRLKHYARQADIQKPLSPHILRHAFATHLVNHGADLRVVQLLLGHSNLSATQIYTHVALARLKALHAEYHPRG